MGCLGFAELLCGVGSPKYSKGCWQGGEEELLLLKMLIWGSSRKDSSVEQAVGSSSPALCRGEWLSPS